MNIQDYVINIEDSSLQDRLKLRQVLLDNGQEIYNAEHSTLLKVHLKKSTEYRHSYDSWRVTATVEPNISLENFIQKFKTSNKLRNLAFYKDSGEEWTDDECTTINEFLGITDNYVGNIAKDLKYYFDDGGSYTNTAYSNWFTQEKETNFSNCLQIKYEDCFMEESKNHKVREKKEVEQEIKVGQIWTSKRTGKVVRISEIRQVTPSGNLIFANGFSTFIKECIFRERFILKDVEPNIPNLCCETALPTCSNEPTIQTNKENTMNATKEQLDLELVKRQIAQLPAVKDAKVKKVKTDLESRKPFTVVVYDENGKYHSTVYYKTLKKAERFKDDYLATKYGYGCTITIHKEVSAYSTKAPIVKVK